MLGKEEIRKRLGFHKVTLEGPNATVPKHRDLRIVFVRFAEILDEMLPDGRYKDVAFHQMEDASMWAHKAIAELAPLDVEDEKKPTTGAISERAPGVQI